MSIAPNPLPAGAEVLPRSQQLKFWFLTNRARIGAVLFALFAAIHFFFPSPGTSVVLDVLHRIVELLVVGSAVTMGAGGFKSDEHHTEDAQAAIRMASGQFPAYQRREGDR